MTVDVGSNQLIGRDTDILDSSLQHILDGKKQSGQVPEFWDGRASEQILEVLAGK